ncbi:hypothetical protein [Streptomyces candidus]|uniref:Uncharacterized protein n=1 Tax=Streptomyces candidus TaxID=67283 RepID=A0A7X0HGV7_9ACTN|nr:hypothetical protein [Streptomyces candidus]MBB6436087.1 hypothetical protein [Streptomyces candidus]GHH43571.1 hypothetical protein GCM10018773_29910 [Streptomyces candidus]
MAREFRVRAVLAEPGSLNPVIVTPAALAARGADLMDEYIGTVTRSQCLDDDGAAGPDRADCVAAEDGEGEGGSWMR